MARQIERGIKVVGIGTTVVVRIDENVESYRIGDDGEGKPSEGIISSRSPLGKALLGRHIGENAEVLAPRGYRYSIKVLSMW